MSVASIEVLGSVFRPECESGGEGGVVVDIWGAEVAMGAGAAAFMLLSEVSRLNECIVKKQKWARVVVAQITEASCAGARSR